MSYVPYIQVHTLSCLLKVSIKVYLGHDEVPSKGFGVVPDQSLVFRDHNGC